MTIKEFSKLCSCEASTLRYYDNVGLLKPGKVDPFSGYRYYDESQALDFVKIKNLQESGFTISEIKSLLNEDNATIYAAFEKKIKEQEALVDKIKKIQMSYQNEMDNMISKLEELEKDLTRKMEGYNATDEFGISGDKYNSIINDIHSLLSSAKEQDPNLVVKDAKYNSFLPIDESKYNIILNKNGWKWAKEFIDDVPRLEKNKAYVLGFSLEADKKNAAFLTTALNLLLDIKDGIDGIPINISALAEETKDGQNHFWLLEEK